MPLVFVHGVNVRRGPLYERELSFRNRHFAEIFYRQLGYEIAPESIFNPYWGELGATVSEDRPFLPRGGYEMLWRRLEAARTSDEPLAIEEVLDSDSSTPLLEIARNSSLEDVIEIVWEMMDEELGHSDHETSHEEHVPETSEMKESANQMARLAQKAFDISHSEEGRKWLATVKTDEELLEKISAFISKHADVSSTRKLKIPGLIKSAGERWRKRLSSARSAIKSRSRAIRQRISEDISSARQRIRQGAVGTTSRILNDPIRALFHQECALLIGDAFSYFSSRGDDHTPAPIAQLVMDSMYQAQELKEKEGGELIVVGHSMGGVILCDIVTCYGRDIPIDVLVTVGSQFPLFADLRMFPGVDPSKRPVPRPENVKKWINIFDPNDFLGYPASHIFDDVVDYHLATYAIGGAAHTNYFNRRSFYFQLARRLSDCVKTR